MRNATRIILRSLPLVALVAGGCLAAPKWAGTDIVVAAPNPADTALDSAADCLERGDEPGAVPHLTSYLAHKPDAHSTRVQLAEILFRRGDADAAEREFDRVLTDAPESGPVHGRRAQCHARLAAIAEARGDEFAENLHRGMGLVALVEKWDAEPERRDEGAAEPVLAKALAALRIALKLHPTDARANLYTSIALRRLGQDDAAGRYRRNARAGLPDVSLSESDHERIVAE